MSLKHDSPKKLRKERKKWKITTPEEFDEREKVFLRERILHKEPTIKTFVRITAGKAKNLKLEIPKTTRPLTDRMKIQIFDTLQKDIHKKNILDLYAGTGSFGLEALSRGAKHVTFVEVSKNAYYILNKNIANTGFLLDSEVVKSKAEEYLYKKNNEKPIQIFDIVFLDPPYKLFNTKKTFKMQNIINMASNLLPAVQNKDTKRFKGALILKHPKRYPLKKLSLDSIELLESHQFGLNTISFFLVKL